MNLQVALKKVETGKLLTSKQVIDCFELHHPDNDEFDLELWEILVDKGNRFSFGDNEFYILNSKFYLEDNGCAGWFVEELKGDTVNEVAAKAVCEYFSEGLSLPESLSYWGLDSEVIKHSDVVSSDFDEPVAVLVKRNFILDSVMTEPAFKFARGDDFNIKQFESYSVAKQWVKDKEKGVYILDNNEIERPDYYIVEYPHYC